MGIEPQIIENYVKPGKVRIVYRHLLQSGEASALGAEASECAADQGRFWEMRLALYDQQQVLYAGDARAQLELIAAGLGMDQAAFGMCVENRTHQAMTEADFKAAMEAGIRSRPVFDIGDKRLVGALPYGQFQATLDAALERR